MTNFARNMTLKNCSKSGIQGKYAGRYQEGTNIILLAGDVAAAFPNDEAVNVALRLVLKLTKLPKAEKSP